MCSLLTQREIFFSLHLVHNFWYLSWNPAVGFCETNLSAGNQEGRVDFFFNYSQKNLFPSPCVIYIQMSDGCCIFKFATNPDSKYSYWSEIIL